MGSTLASGAGLEWSGETSQEAVAESLTGGDGGSWVYKTPRFKCFSPCCNARTVD